jgi:hypothetical protein
MVVEASRRFGGKPHNCHKGPKRRDRTDRATRCQPHPQPSRARSIDGAAPSSTAISLTGTAIGAAWTDTAPSADKPEVDDHLSGGVAARTRTSSSGRNSTPISSKVRWRAPMVAASGRCRSISKLSITLAGTEAALANLLRDQLSNVRAERH